MRTFFLLSILLLCASCGFKVPSAPTYSAEQRLNEADAKVFLEKVKAHSKKIRTFRGRFDVAVETSFSEESLSQVLAFQAPSKLRLEFFATNLNALTALLITNGGSLHAVDPINDKVYRGRATEGSIERLLSIPFSPEGLMRWAVGAIALPEDVEKLNPEVFSNGDSFVVKFKDSASKSVLGVFRERSEEFGDLELKRFEILRPDGKRVLITDYDYDAKPDEGSPVILPKQIGFWLVEKKLRGTLSVDRFKLNPEFTKRDKKLFLGRTPAGAKIFYLEPGMNASGVQSFL